MRTDAFTAWNGNRTFVTPSVDNCALVDGGSTQSITSPVCNRFRVSVSCQNVSLSRITILHFVRCPPYISRFIMTIVVDTIQRMFGRRPASQFFQKLFVGIKAKLNTSAAITRIGCVSYTFATMFGSMIRLPLWCFMGFTVLSSVFAQNATAYASTGNCFAAPQVTSPYYCVISTDTQTFPHGFSSSGVDNTGKSRDSQRSELLSGQVLKATLRGFGLKDNINIHSSIVSQNTTADDLNRRLEELDK